LGGGAVMTSPATIGNIINHSRNIRLIDASFNFGYKHLADPLQNVSGCYL